MTRKHRNPSSTTKLFSDSSAVNSYRHRRRTKPHRSTVDYNTEDSQSRSQFSPYDSNNDDVSEHPTVDYDNASYRSGSGSASKPVLRSEFLTAETFQGYRSYVNIAPLPVFGGFTGECPVTHLSRFAKVCRANNAVTVEMMMRIFPVTLLDEAALWYDLNIEPYITSLSWEQIKSSFIEAYRVIKPPDQLRRELMTHYQDTDEPVRSYFLRLQRLLAGFPDHGLSDSLLKAIFINGLSEDLRDWVLKQNPQSLDEALCLAVGYERLKVGTTLGIYRRVSERSGGNDSESGGSKVRDCRCSKHRCWEKGVDRNYSLVSRDSTTAE